MRRDDTAVDDDRWRGRHERLWRLLGHLWVTLLILCPPLVVWVEICDGYDAWRLVARNLELTERRAGVLALSLLSGIVGAALAGGSESMAGIAILAVCGVGAGWVMSRPYRRTIMAVRRGQAPVAAVRQAQAEVERVLTAATTGDRWES